nr:MAG TPA: hypothetical protein [Caudoviricetes sp.]
MWIRTHSYILKHSRKGSSTKGCIIFTSRI